MQDQEAPAGNRETEPIATYAERLLEVRRVFALYDDRVVVQARWLLKGRFEHVVKLSGLTPEIQELTIRYRIYRNAGWILAVGALGFAASYYSAKGGPLGIVGNIAMGVMIVGVLLMAMTYRNRRIWFARFNTKAGKPGLDIGSAGNNLAAYQAFVEQVRKRIRKSRQ